MVAIEVGDGVVFLVVGFILLQGLWLSVLTYLLYKRAQDASSPSSTHQSLDETVVEEVFLLHRSGLLIRHLTRRLKPHVDSDILTGMLRVVQEFVRDSFREEVGELTDMTFGELKISICGGRHTVLVTVIRGERPADILDQMKGALADLEGAFGARLKGWGGMVEDTHFVDAFLERLIHGKYTDGEPTSPPLLLAE